MPAINFLNYVDRFAARAVAPTINQELALTGAQIGFLAAAFRLACCRAAIIAATGAISVKPDQLTTEDQWAERPAQAMVAAGKRLGVRLVVYKPDQAPAQLSGLDRARADHIERYEVHLRHRPRPIGIHALDVRHVAE
jgi:hypothetical protein